MRLVGMADPILRWAGGKRQIISDIVSRLPPKRDFNNYYEPFFGGGAVFFNIEPSNGYINDINEPLMDFYRLFRDNFAEIIDMNKRLDDELNQWNNESDRKHFYYTRRREFNELHNGQVDDELREAALFLFLNRTCWNGLYRTNRDGDFNVPMKSGVIETNSIESNLRRGHKVLQNTTITSKDFTYILDEVKEDDLVFLDPPYVQESDARQFDEYSPGGFDEERQEEVRDLALDLHNRGAYVMITNSYRAKEMYFCHNEFAKNFRIKPIKAARTINSDSSQRIEIGNTDIIVTNSPQFWEQKDFNDFR